MGESNGNRNLVNITVPQYGVWGSHANQLVICLVCSPADSPSEVQRPGLTSSAFLFIFATDVPSLTSTHLQYLKILRTTMGSAAASPRLYTSAQVAGISVGTSMGVFLLTLVVLLLLIHRRRSHAESQRRLGNGLHRLTPGATATTLEAPPQPARNRPPPQDIVDIISLPSPVFDNELGRQNSIIKTSIANHVYQFYGDRLPKKFNRTGLSTGLSENELDILLRDQRRQSLVICQFFAQQLLASISPFYEPEFALLPSRWVELLRDSPLHGPDTSRKLFLYIII